MFTVDFGWFVTIEHIAIKYTKKQDKRVLPI